MQRTLATLDPAKTAGILISKTFGTQETLLNGQILHDWLGGSERLYAVSANPERAAKAFAIAADRVLPMWDWVGGRYSLWSAVGFPIALAIGFERLSSCWKAPRRCACAGCTAGAQPAGAARPDRHLEPQPAGPCHACGDDLRPAPGAAAGLPAAAGDGKPGQARAA
jgi:hypothetical protein